MLFQCFLYGRKKIRHFYHVFCDHQKDPKWWLNQLMKWMDNMVGVCVIFSLNPFSSIIDSFFDHWSRQYRRVFARSIIHVYAFVCGGGCDDYRISHYFRYVYSEKISLFSSITFFGDGRVYNLWLIVSTKQNKKKNPFVCFSIQSSFHSLHFGILVKLSAN